MATVAQSPARGETLELLEPVEYHYMPKVAITEGIVNGTAGRALCGEVFTPYAPGRGEGGGMAVICDRCAAIYGSLRSLGRDA